MQCQKIRDGKMWECHRCESLWFDTLHATGWRPPLCPERTTLEQLEAAVHEARTYGVGATSDTNQKILLDAACSVLSARKKSNPC